MKKIESDQAIKDQLQEAPQKNEDLTELVDIIENDIGNLASIRRNVEREASSHQQLIEKITRNVLGRPFTLYVIFLATLLWIIFNIAGQIVGLPVYDSPPYFWLQGFIGFVALLTTTAVLITQNRQSKLTDQRTFLELELSLLTERKVSKLIELVEALRKDMPQVANRQDNQADIMKESADPVQVLTMFQETYQEAIKDTNSAS